MERKWTKKDTLCVVLMPFWLPFYFLGRLGAITFYALICGYKEGCISFDALFGGGAK